MKGKQLTFLICLISVTGLTLGENPHLKIRVTSAGLDYVRDLVIQLVHEQFTSFNIPDQSGDFHAVIATAHYIISNIRVSDSGLSSSNMKLNLVAGKGITASLSDVTIRLTSNWAYHIGSGWTKISDHGTLDVSAAVSLSISATSGINQGLPTLSVFSCNFYVHDVNAKFHGGASWLYNLFRGKIDGAIKNAINGQACPKITGAAAKQGQVAFQNLNLNYSIRNNVDLNLLLVEAPSFTADYVESFHVGEFTFEKQSPHCLSKNESLRLLEPPPTGKMLYIFVSEQMLNSLAFAYQSAGLLQLTRTKKEIHTPLFALDTDSVGLFIPNLRKFYPENHDMAVHVRVRLPIKFSMLRETVSVPLAIDADAYVLFQNGTKKFVFTLEIALNLTLGIWLRNEGSKLHLGLSKNLTNISSIVLLKKSAIGEFPVASLNVPVEIAVPMFLKGAEEHGFSLPTTSELFFLEPSASVENGAIVVGTNIKYPLQTS